MIRWEVSKELEDTGNNWVGHLKCQNEKKMKCQNELERWSDIWKNQNKDQSSPIRIVQ